MNGAGRRRSGGQFPHTDPSSGRGWRRLFTARTAGVRLRHLDAEDRVVGSDSTDFVWRRRCVDAAEELADLPFPSLQIRAQNRLLVGLRDFAGDKVFAPPAEQELAVAGGRQGSAPIACGREARPATSPPARVSRLTGTRRARPVFRPRTSSMREPQTLIPRRVRAATKGLKTLRVNQSGAM